jgi:allophanate hydrolase
MGQVVDAVEEVYRRIEANASNAVFIHMVPKGKALERAAAVEKMPKVSPLWGKPFVVKDNMDVEGLPTTAGCPAFSYTPKKTATAVQKILDAGGVLIGKTNLDQFATGLTGMRSAYGAVKNAFDEKYISGGSSSGSAVAVALGIVGFSLGTDTAGSGRVPAAFNGLVGFKPTRGLVSGAGVVPAVRSLDCVSIFALSCAEAQQVLSAIEGPDANDPYSRTGTPVQFSPQQFKFAVPSNLEFHGDSGYAKLFAQAILKLRQLGGAPVEIDFAPFVEAGAMLYGPWVAERAAHLEPYMKDMLPVIREILEGAKKYSAVDFFKARNRLDELKQKARETFKQADVILVPTAPTIYTVAQVEKKPIDLNNHLGHYTAFTNLLDLAAISLPAGMRQDGVPFGISLIAPAFTDKALLALGARFQS